MKRSPVTNEVVSATGLLNIWLLKHDGIKEKGRKPIDRVSMEIESYFLDFVVKDKIPDGLPQGAKLFGHAERRLGALSTFKKHFTISAFFQLR